MPLESMMRHAPPAVSCYDDQRKRPLRALDGPYEQPLTLSLNDTAMVTLLATPEALEPLAMGHAFTAGWIERADQVEGIHLSRLRHGLAVRLDVAPRLVERAASLQRAGASVSSCGACGVAEESQLMLGLTRLPAQPALAPSALALGVDTLQRLIVRGQHTALALDEEGQVLARGVDIGRHNALDRVIGDTLVRGVTPAAVLLSSRCSLELVQKTVRAGIGTLATLSLPSALAVEVARTCDLNLICCHRGRRLERLSGPL
ncbi:MULTISPECIES: formate dehydrogenase accessory sulfurtransferase FdhD [Halomonadaceae]|uniref:formate dehydrogenase accessory sulfurtransferase FdhD n=1 Tax=Halomonadaceae TaxID=28256 RepID=UPI001598E819|nr:MULTISPECIES: formate dehydrogenase accessory sulfurtransferase FdhD [Halomonas]QJQ95803.1 formate dehydrogenase accessory sulfurtransferase FdhD [Halomonas sp. PA5]